MQITLLRTVEQVERIKTTVVPIYIVVDVENYGFLLDYYRDTSFWENQSLIFANNEKKVKEPVNFSLDTMLEAQY
jgi:hypothetical protein